MEINHTQEQIGKLIKDLTVCGIYFYTSPIIVFDKNNDEIFLTIETFWSIHNKSGEREWFSNVEIEKLLNKINLIRLSKISEVKINDDNVIDILFSNNYVLSMKPSKDYESWNISSSRQDHECILIIGLPGGKISIEQTINHDA